MNRLARLTDHHGGRAFACVLMLGTAGCSGTMKESAEDAATAYDASGPDDPADAGTARDTSSSDAMTSPNDGGTRDAPAGDAGPPTDEDAVTVGGGEPYVDQQRAADEPTFCDSAVGDHVVGNRSELETALETAAEGEVIYLEGSAEIDFTGPNAWGDPVGIVKSGVTLASNRGCEGAEGGHLYTTAPNEPLLGAERDARITGVRLSGPFYDWADRDSAGDGIKVTGADVEVDNSEIWGFSYASVHAGQRTHVHHNFIHHNPRHGLGYGVSGGNEVLIEYNHFRNNRHSVANNGRNSYTARYNYVDGEVISHAFDMHKEGGETVLIHHNTVVPVDQVDDPKKAPAVTIRGVPSDVAEIHHNWLYNPEAPCTSNDGESWEDCSIHQRWVDDFQNVEFHDNHYGESDPGDCNIGAPREGC